MNKDYLFIFLFIRIRQVIKKEEHFIQREYHVKFLSFNIFWKRKYKKGLLFYLIMLLL